MDCNWNHLELKKEWEKEMKNFHQICVSIYVRIKKSCIPFEINLKAGLTCVYKSVFVCVCVFLYAQKSFWFTTNRNLHKQMFEMLSPKHSQIFQFILIKTKIQQNGTYTIRIIYHKTNASLDSALLVLFWCHGFLLYKINFVQMTPPLHFIFVTPRTARTHLSCNLGCNCTDFLQF